MNSNQPFVLQTPSALAWPWLRWFHLNSSWSVLLQQSFWWGLPSDICKVLPGEFLRESFQCHWTTINCCPLKWWLQLSTTCHLSDLIQLCLHQWCSRLQRLTTLHCLLEVAHEVVQPSGQWSCLAWLFVATASPMLLGDVKLKVFQLHCSICSCGSWQTQSRRQPWL